MCETNMVFFKSKKDKTQFDYNVKRVIYIFQHGS